MRGLFLVLAVFSLLGGALACLITYDGAQHHLERRQALRESAKAGGRILVALLLLAIVAVVGFDHLAP